MRVYDAKSLKGGRTSPRLNSVEVFAPGRLNLIGEHTDYNGGKVLPFCIERGLETQIDLFDDKSGEIRVFSASFEQVLECSWRQLRSGVELPSQGWTHYVVGALVHFLEIVPENFGLDVVISSGLPVGAGVSSSAALCVSLLSGLGRVFDCELDPDELAKKAQAIEHEFAGTRCGLMDQLAILHGKPDTLLLIDFDPSPGSSYSIRPVRLHPGFEDYECVVINTNVKHSLAESAYNERRSECERGLFLLQKHFGKPISSLGALARADSFQSYFGLSREPGCQGALMKILVSDIFVQEPNAEILAKRCAHAIVENIRVDEALEAVLVGDVRKLAIAMDESHASLRDFYEVSCPELEMVRDLAVQAANSLGRSLSVDFPIVGPRLCGGGFGGSVIMLLHRKIAGKVVSELSQGASDYEEAFGISPTAWLVRIGSGVRFKVQSQAEGWI
jgi:galactokinase